MISACSLVIGGEEASAASSFRLEAAAELPVRVETAAWAVAVAGELRLLINQPGAGETRQYRVLPALNLESLPALPLVAAGAACCGPELVVTGASAAGRPLALWVAADGTKTRQIAFEGPQPSRWPVPGCAPEPVIAWQITPDKLEVGFFTPPGLTINSVRVGGPPFDWAAGGRAVWAVWGTDAGLHGVEIRTREVCPFQLPGQFPSAVAIGGSADGAYLAWTQEDSLFCTGLSTAGKPAVPPLEIELGKAAGGLLKIITGPGPLIWAQRGRISGRESRWTSALVLPNSSPFMIEGLIHAVAWWGGLIAVVGSEEICLLKPAQGIVPQP